MYTQEEDHQRFKDVDPRLREEVGGILERAFQRENGVIPEESELQKLELLAGEVEQKVKEAELKAEEAVEAARRASERFAVSHALDDMEAVQHWEAEADSYRREAEEFRQEVERLRKYLPG